MYKIYKQIITLLFLLCLSGNIKGNTDLNHIDSLLYNDPVKAVTYINENLAEAEYLHEFYCRLGEAYDIIGETDSSIYYLEKAIDFLREKNMRYPLADISIVYGRVLTFTGFFNRAYDVNMEALRIYREMDDSLGLARALMSLGVLYRNLGLTEKANANYMQAYPIFHSHNDAEGKGDIYNHLGSIYWYEGNNKKAMELYEKSFGIRNKNHIRQDKIAAVLNNIGNVFRSEGQFELAEKYYNNAYKIVEEIDDVKLQTVVMKNLGLLKKNIGNNNEALQLLFKSNHLAQKIRFYRIVKITLKYISDIFLSENKNLKANYYLNNYITLQDSLLTAQNKIAISDIEIREHLMVNKDKILSLEREAGRNKLLLLISLTVFSIFVIVVLFSRFLIKKRLSASLEEKNRQISEQNSELIKLNASLRSSRERLKAIVNESVDSIVLLDEEGKIIEWNAASAKATNISYEKAIGCYYWDIIYEFAKRRGKTKTGRSFYRNMILKVLSTGDPKEWKLKNFEIQNSKGVVLHGNQVVFTIKTTKGYWMGAITRDITEWRKTKNELLEHQQNYFHIFNSVEDAIIVFDRKFSKIYEINKPGARHFGFRSGDFSEEDWKSRCINDSQFSYNKLTNLLKSVKKDEVISFEWKFYSPDGRKFWTENVIKSININNIEKLLLVSRDATLRKKLENEIRTSEERLRTLFENVTIGIYRSNIQGDIIMTNPALVKMLGYSSLNELLQKKIGPDAFLDPESRSNFIEIISKKGIIKGFETKWRKKDGSIIIIRESARAIKNSEGEIEYFEGVVEDFTEYRRVQDELIMARDRAERADKLKSEFLAQMSHEIRTPINSILSFSGLIKEEIADLLNEELKSCFSLMDNAGKRIIRTVDLLLNMSEIQAGTFQVSFRNFNLYNEILNPAFMEHRFTANERGLNFIMDNVDRDIILYKDQYTVGQIVNNLVDNALKYTEKGKVELSAVRLDNDKVMIEVCDTGIGISEEYLPNLFVPFTQEEQGYTRKFEGNGLGLALVKKYCQLNGAEISVESTKGKGSSFRVIFPGIKKETE